MLDTFLYLKGTSKVKIRIIQAIVYLHSQAYN